MVIERMPSTSNDKNLMLALISLLHEFLANRVTPRQFSLAFIDIWRALRDEQYQRKEQNQELKKALDELFAKRLAGKIGPDTFMAEYRPIAEELYKHCTIKAFSKEEEIIGRLFYVTEGYSPPELRGPGDWFNVTEAEVYEVAKQALENLTS
jgi:hypothetical protein